MKFKASEMNLILLPKTHQEKYTKLASIVTSNSTNPLTKRG